MRAAVFRNARLAAWLASPEDAVPGDRMPFLGIPGVQARADIMASLRQSRRGMCIKERRDDPTPSLP